MYTRKNVKILTSTEKQNLIKAIKAVKATGKYDKYVQMHADAAAHPCPATVLATYRNAAHQGPAFLPWHRNYLLLYERDLQAAVPGVTLPFWDWAADSSLSNPATATVWGSDLMGGNGNPNNNDYVTTGSFAYNPSDPNSWYVVGSDGVKNGGLQRHFGQAAGGLPSQSDVYGAIGQSTYDISPWDGTSGEGPDHRNMLEGWYQCCHLHNQVHLWVGGSMRPLTSPNDPVFFLHHCFVDFLWSVWQSQHPSAGYLPTSGDTGHNLSDPMYPWNTGTNNVTPASMLSIANLGYQYQYS